MDRDKYRLSDLDPELLDGARGEAEKQAQPCVVAEVHLKGINVRVQHRHVEIETSRGST
jgi:hypothetical protein